MKFFSDIEPSETVIEAGWLKAIELGATGPGGLQDQKAMFILGFRLGWRYRWATSGKASGEATHSEPMFAGQPEANQPWGGDPVARPKKKL